MSATIENLNLDHKLIVEIKQNLKSVIDRIQENTVYMQEDFDLKNNNHQLMLSQLGQVIADGRNIFNAPEFTLKAQEYREPKNITRKQQEIDMLEKALAYNKKILSILIKMTEKEIPQVPSEDMKTIVEYANSLNTPSRPSRTKVFLDKIFELLKKLTPKDSKDLQENGKVVEATQLLLSDAAKNVSNITSNNTNAGSSVTGARMDSTTLSTRNS